MQGQNVDMEEFEQKIENVEGQFVVSDYKQLEYFGLNDVIDVDKQEEYIDSSRRMVCVGGCDRVVVWNGNRVQGDYCGGKSLGCGLCI